MELPDSYTSVITLDVPSGKIIVTDDLRPVYDWRDEEAGSYNTALGQLNAIRLMAEQGCAYGPVGNSCPSLYRTGPDTYVIANPAFDEDDGREIIPEGWEGLAWIITDLWAYSAADWEDYLSRGGTEACLEHKGKVVDVPPGRYEFTHHTGEAGFDGFAAGTVVFADIRRLP
jgi:hypothetical protein